LERGEEEKRNDTRNQTFTCFTCQRKCYGPEGILVHERRKSMSDLINIKNVLCHAKNHSFFELGRLCTYDELLLKIAEAAKTKDASSVIFYFTLEEERRRDLHGKS
jgi:hypothetical protein